MQHARPGHPLQRSSSLPPAARLRLVDDGGVQDAHIAHLRSELRTKTLGPEASYEHRHRIEEALDHDRNHVIEQYVQHYKRTGELGSRQGFRPMWQSLADRALDASDRNAHAARLAQQADLLERLQARRRPHAWELRALGHGSNSDSDGSWEQARRDDRLLAKTRMALPGMANEMRHYHRVFHFAQRQGFQRDNPHHKDTDMEALLRHRALEGKLRTDRLTAADEAALRERAGRPLQERRHDHLLHEWVGRSLLATPRGHASALEELGREGGGPPPEEQSSPKRARRD